MVLLRRALFLVLPLALLAAWLTAEPANAQGRPDCTTILREFHHHSGVPDAAKIASKLDVDSDWVEKCAATYGRRIKPKEAKISENDRELTAKVEEKEYEETAREEAGEQANIVQGDLDDYKPRDRVRGIDPDSSAEWEPYLTHEWQPYTAHEWEPFILDDDHPNEE
jgi:hypothetical protein